MVHAAGVAEPPAATEVQDGNGHAARDLSAFARVGAVLGPVLAPLPKPLSGLVISVVLIAAMTWVVMPRATRMFKRWLYPSG